RRQGSCLRRRVPGGLHLRGQPDALHPARRMRGLRRLRTRLPRRGDLLRGRHPGPVGRVLPGQRRVLRRPRRPRRRREDGRDRQGPPDHRGPPAAAQPPGLSMAATPAPGPGPARTGLAGRLPAFPWDSLLPAKQQAAAHPDGIADLSVGTPVDPTPASVQAALADAADSPGYPTTIGTPALREALVEFVRRHRGAPEALDVQGAVPTVGSKELVAHLPFQLGLGPGDAVAFPHIAYPPYDMGARSLGAEPLPVDIAALAAHGDAALPDPSAAQRIRLLWLNSPSNPTGAVLDVAQLAAVVAWARRRGIVVASDECYALLPWTVDEVPSVLDARVNGGSLDDLLCVYSLSKQSNLAGYRAAFVAGDPAL